MLENIKVKEIVSVFSAYHKEGNVSHIQSRFAYGISFASSGRIVYRKEEQTAVEDTAHAVLLPMGGSYRLRCTEEGHFPLINFTAVEPIARDIVTVPLSRHGVFVDKFHSLREAFFAYGSTARAMSLLYDILDELSRESSHSEHLAVTRATERILTCFFDPTLSAEALAADAGVSDAYLRRLFKEAHGISPKAYLQAVRLRRAKELLSLGFHTVGEVAAKCGYASIYHFCRVFKSETGLAPKEYARRYPIKGL